LLSPISVSIGDIPGGGHREFNIQLQAQELDETAVLMVTINSDNAPPLIETIIIATLESQLGDVNEDGVVDLQDIILIAMYLTGQIELSENQQNSADVNADGNIDIFDIIKIARFLAGLMDSLSADTILPLGGSQQLGTPSLDLSLELEDDVQALAPGQIATIRLSSDSGLLGLQVGPEGRLRYDPEVLRIRAIYGVGPYQVLAANIDNARGEARFIILRTGDTPYRSTEAETILEVEVEAVGDVGERTEMVMMPDLAIDIHGQAISPTVSREEIVLRPAPALHVQEILVYPTPAKGRAMWFRVNGQGIRTLQVQVYDLSGQKVYDSGAVVGPALRWDLRNAHGRPLANGVYLYVVTVSGYDGRVVHDQVKKLVILRQRE
jgi:hypothetical protein